MDRSEAYANILTSLRGSEVVILFKIDRGMQPSKGRLLGEKFENSQLYSIQTKLQNEKGDVVGDAEIIFHVEDISSILVPSQVTVPQRPLPSLFKP